MFAQIIQMGKKTFYLLGHSLYVCESVCDVCMIGLKLTSQFARECHSIQKKCLALLWLHSGAKRVSSE